MAMRLGGIDPSKVSRICQAAAAKVLEGATWQRCRVHFMRKLLAHIPEEHKSMVAKAAWTIFARPDRGRAGDQAKEVVRALEPRWPKAAELLRQAEDDILAYMAFPKAHWSRISSTNPLERVNLEIRRRTNVVGVFPNDASVMRLVGTILREIDDEWRTREGYFSQESIKQLRDSEPSLFDVPAPFTLAAIR